MRLRFCGDNAEKNSLAQDRRQGKELGRAMVGPTTGGRTNSGDASNRLGASL